MKRYEKIKLIGKGSFGTVYKAKVMDTQEIVAYKVMTKLNRSPKEIDGLRREYKILYGLHHPNIIKMLDSFETDYEIVVVSEYADEELYDVLGKVKRLGEDRAREILCDLISAIHYLHYNRIVHRDLKPHNVLLDSRGRAKLCDFGFARSMSSGTHLLTSIKGTPLYMAPELIQELPYDYKVDLWSLGCIAYELVAGRPPFKTRSMISLIYIIQNEPVRWPNYLSEGCVDFLKGLLEKDPMKRFSWNDLLSHPYVLGRVPLTQNCNVETPLTDSLSSSQNRAKEIQKNSLLCGLADKQKLASMSSKYMKPRLPHPLSNKMYQMNELNKLTSNLNLNYDPRRNEISNYVNIAKFGAIPKTNNSASTNKNKSSVSLSSSLAASSGNANWIQTEISELKQLMKVELVHKINRLNEIHEERKRKLLDRRKSSFDDMKLLSKISFNDIKEETVQPIENGEWLAFLEENLAEIVDGDLESLKDKCFLTIIIAPLKNSSASFDVIKYTASLLFLPFVIDDVSTEEKDLIRQVYNEAELIPNLVYSTKLLLWKLNELPTEHLQTLEVVLLLITNLVYNSEESLEQFINASIQLKMTAVYQSILSLRRQNLKIVSDLLSILCQILRKKPQFAKFVSKLVLGDNPKDNSMPVDIHSILISADDSLRERICTLLHLMALICPDALNAVWNETLRSDIEALDYDSCVSVRNEAANALLALKKMPNFNAEHS